MVFLKIFLRVAKNVGRVPPLSDETGQPNTMKNNNTTLIMPTTTMQPKPTKTEIVEAMLTRAKLKHDAENERRKKLREVLRKKIETLALKLAKGMTPEVSVYAYSNSESSHCDVRINRVKSPELDALMSQYKDLELIYWDEKEMRNTIKRELSGIQKPSPTRLLDNPATVKAMDAMLEQWGL